MSLTDHQLNFSTDFNKTTKFVLSETLPTILDVLTTPELLKYRLVSRSWNKEITTLVRKRTNWHVPFIFYEDLCSPTFIRRLAQKGDSCYGPARIFDRKELKFRGEKKTLSEFTNLLQLTPHTPFLVTRLEFDSSCTGFLELPEVFDFLRTYGVYIEELRLTNYDNYYLGQMGWNSNCILKYTPNLKTLSVRVAPGSTFPFSEAAIARRVNYPNDNKPNENEYSGPVLQHLKFIEVVGMWTTRELHASDLKLINLLTIAQTIRAVYFHHRSFPLKMTPALVSGNKIHLLKINRIELELFHLLKNNLEDLGHLEHLVSSGDIDLNILVLSTDLCALQSLCDPGQGDALVGQPNPQLVAHWARMFDCLLKLMEKNNNSLKTLIIQNSACFFWKTQKTVGHIPQLTNVSSLTFRWADFFFETVTHTIYPVRKSIKYDYVPPTLFDNFPAVVALKDSDDVENRSISTMFPALETLNICWNFDAHPSWFPFWDEIFPTVKTLHLQPGRGNKNINLVTPKLPAMFPALRSLSIKVTVPGFPRNFKELLKLKSLEKLSLVIISNTDKDRKKQRNELVTLATLLGLKMKTLEATYPTWKIGRKVKMPSNFNNRPSVFDFSGLKELCLELRFFEKRARKFFGRVVAQLAAQKTATFQVYFAFNREYGDFSPKNGDLQEFFQTLSKSFPNAHTVDNSQRCFCYS